MRRRLLRVLVITVGVALVLAAAAAGVAYWQARSIVGELQAGPKAADVRRARPELNVEPRQHFVAPKVEQAHGAQTILLIGSDRRWSTPGSARSDTIILARIDATHHRIGLLSIPRDLYVEIPGHGHARINEAFTQGGAGLLIRTVREEFGVAIDHFVEVNFSGFRNLVDHLGGVYLPIEQRYYNVNVHTPGTNYANIDLRPGYQKLTGANALAFARFRHTDSDLYRAARQQIFLHAVLGKLLSWSANPLEWRSRARSFARATTSDISSLGELWWLFQAVHSTPARSLERRTLAVQDLTLYGADYLDATAAERRRAVHVLYATPRVHHTAPADRSGPARSAGARTAAALVPDGGEGKSLLGPRVPIRRCAPTALPRGYAWGAVDPARSYALDGHPAIAAWATAGSGHSILWMWTTWSSPPALDHPTTTVTRGTTTYSVWTENGRIRQVAWRIGPTRVWITNTLRNELDNRVMLALAASCRALAP